MYLIEELDVRSIAIKSKNLSILWAGVIMVVAITPGFASDVYKSQKVQQDTVKSIEVYKSQDVQPYTGKAPEIHKSQEVQPYRGREIDVYKAPAAEEYKGTGPAKPASEPVREKPKATVGKAPAGVTILGCKNVQCDTREGIMPGLTTVEILLTSLEALC